MPWLLLEMPSNMEEAKCDNLLYEMVGHTIPDTPNITKAM